MTSLREKFISEDERAVRMMEWYLGFKGVVMPSRLWTSRDIYACIDEERELNGAEIPAEIDDLIVKRIRQSEEWKTLPTEFNQITFAILSHMVRTTAADLDGIDITGLSVIGYR